MDRERAVIFVRANGSPADVARLHFLAALAEGFGAGSDGSSTSWISTGQNLDGGFPSRWSGASSSIDATCFRLAQAEWAPGHKRVAGVSAALDFLVERQAPPTPEDAGGWWEEDPVRADSTPPWARPGDAAARLYLTANAGCRLFLGRRRAGGLAAATWVETALDAGGTPPAAVSQWLAAGALLLAGRPSRVGSLLEALEPAVDHQDGAGLAWLLTTLLVAGVRPDHRLVESAASALSERQRPDGAIPSSDGNGFVVHATLEALRAFALIESSTDGSQRLPGEPESTVASVGSAPRPTPADGSLLHSTHPPRRYE